MANINAEKILNEFWEKNPHLKQRKFRIKGIEAISGITFEEYKLASTVDRYYRNLPRDENSHRLETEALDELGYSARSISDCATLF